LKFKMAEENIAQEMKEKKIEKEVVEAEKVEMNKVGEKKDSPERDLDSVKKLDDGSERAQKLEDTNISKTEEKKEDVKKDEKKDEKKAEDKKKVKPVSSGPKKTSALVNGKDLRISTKQAVAICNMIRGKDVDRAIIDLEEVAKMKRAVPMKGEIPHKKGKGMMSGRYPINAVGEFIKLVKSLKANAIVNEMELEKFKISAMANKAARPFKRFGQGRMKRSHVLIKLIKRERVKGKNKVEEKK